jgi:hypothetical protein
LISGGSNEKSDITTPTMRSGGPNYVGQNS